MKINKFTRRLIIWCLILSIINPSFILTVSALDEETDYVEQKTYSDATIEDDFSDNRVMIVMNHDASMELKEYTIDDFSEINAKDITDLASSKREKAIAQFEVMKQALLNRKPLNAEELVSYKNYNQVICLELEEPGKDKVLEAIKILEQR